MATTSGITPAPLAPSIALTAAGAEWHVGVEANGWDVMLHLANLGVGIAIVNDFCRVPRNCVARRIKDLPPVRYYRVTRETQPSSEAVDTLIAELRRVKDR